MRYIDPHIHCVSRTTDDYKRMALAGCQMVSEPAFWAGFDRSGAEGFRDYFRQLTQYEPKRAEMYGIAHACWLCINAKEAENVALSREVIAMIPEFLDQPNVLGIGEIGLAGIAAAITDAVRHATGVLVRDLPVRIEDLLEA